MYDEKLLGTILNNFITNRLPNSKYYTKEAYEQLINDVLEEVFGEKVEQAVRNANGRIKWNEKVERYEYEQNKD